MAKKESNFLEGNLWKQIIFFALPIIATSMLQQIFNATDTAVVGRFAGSDALAAVGSTSTTVGLCITMMTGLSVGANVRIAHAIGQKNESLIKKNVDTSMLIALIMGFVLMLVGELIGRPLLELLGTPENILADATEYIRVYFLCFPFLMIYNFEAAILRASGDSKKPLYCLGVSGVLNLGFNLLFVIVFRMGVLGVALGTLISNIGNMIAATYFLIKGNDIVKLELHDIQISSESARLVFSVGIPAALQGMMFNLSNLIIQTGINSLGADAIAANTVAMNAEVFVYFLLNGFGQATVTFVGQNYGAGNINRCKKSVRVSVIVGAVSTLILASLFIVFAKPLCSIFTTNPNVVDLAKQRMEMILYFEVCNLAIEVMSGALRGLGKSTLPTVLSAIFICGTRIIWMVWFFPMYRTYGALNIVYPISWIFAAIAIGIAYVKVIRSLEKEAMMA